MQRAIFFVAAAVLVSPSSVPAQQVSAQERLAIRICAADISARCSGVEGGQGHLRSCVKEHLKDFSEPCQVRLAKLAAIREACAADIKENCAGSTGPRRVAACLKAALANLGDACKEALAQAVARAPR